MLGRALLLLLALVLAPGGNAQTLPSLTEGANYSGREWSWRDHDGGYQNWDVTQAPNGILFVANQDGLLEFDGEDWRIHPMPLGGQTTVRSVAIDQRGQVYAGGIGDFGRLVADSSGMFHFHSLRDQLPVDEQVVGDVWTTRSVNEGVVFQTNHRLFVWDGNTMEILRTSTRFRTSYVIDGVLLVNEQGKGLQELDRGRLKLVEGGGFLADKKVDGVLSREDGNILAVVRGEGLVRVTEEGTAPVGGAASAYLKTYRPYGAVEVPQVYGRRGRMYAVATFGGGIAIVDDLGRLVRVYREDVGLSQEDTVVGLEVDHQGGLWVAHLNGVLRIDLLSRSSWFDDRSGLPGIVEDVQRSGDALYAATSVGLYRLTPGRLGRPGDGRPLYARFEPVDGTETNEQVFDLSPTPNGVLAAANTGVYAVEGGTARRASSTPYALSLLAPSERPDWRLVGRRDGIGILVYHKGQWRDEGRVPRVEGDSRYMVEGADGTVWVSQTGGSLYLISGIRSRRLQVREFDTTGDSSPTAGPLVRVGDDILMTSREGIFRLELNENGELRTVRVEGLGLSGVYALYEVGGEFWVFQNGVLRSLRNAGEDGRPFEIRNVQVLDVTEDEDGVVWIGMTDGLLRYDPRIRELEGDYSAFIRRVANRQRETLYGGVEGWQGEPLVVPYGDNSELRFEAAAATFGRPEATEYQFRLDGWDSDWGAWGPERVASFTNLWEGEYTLRVRARNVHGQLSEEATFDLIVLPPWYRTWWAFGLYVLGLGTAVWGISTWRLRKNGRKLATQRAQSARLKRLSARLERSNAQLRQADRLKDDLLANTSHELRTPLTAILGFSEMLLESLNREDERDLARGIQRGGQRLLGTVNGLLDMFKLQSGTMPVEVQEVDAVRVVQESVDLLQPIAVSRGLDLYVVAESPEIPALLDPALLDRVVTNLTGNALKFTPEGRVCVRVRTVGGDLQIAVRDTGIGIASKDAARIFEPFEQASSGFSRTHEGTGLGLAIVRRVLDLAGGRVHVESDIGQGTTITVTLPRCWTPEQVPRLETDDLGQPALEGAHVLGVGLDAATVGTLRDWIEPSGTVRGTKTIGRALREARKTVFDTVLIGASTAERERKLTRLLRSVPGYEYVPLIRVGSERLSSADLEERGFFGQVQTPLNASAAVAMLEDLLGRVEEAAQPVL